MKWGRRAPIDWRHFDRLDEVKREVSPTARELFVAADKKPRTGFAGKSDNNESSHRPDTRRQGIPSGKTGTQHVQTNLTQNAALSRNNRQDCPRRPPNRDAALSALKPDGGTRGGATLAARSAPCRQESFAPRLRAWRACIIGRRLSAGSSALLNQSILAHDVGVLVG